MHQYQERDEEDDRNPGGKTRVKAIQCAVKGGGRNRPDKMEE